MGILIADDHASVRSAIRLLLELDAGLEVVGEAACGRELLACIAATSPRLLMIDAQLRGMPERPLLALRDQWPRLMVLVLDRAHRETSASYFVGADAYLSKLDPPERLLASVRLLLDRANDRSTTALQALVHSPSHRAGWVV